MAPETGEGDGGDTESGDGTEKGSRDTESGESSGFERGAPPKGEEGPKAPELYFEEGYDVTSIPEKFVSEGRLDVGKLLKSQSDGEAAYRKLEQTSKRGEAPDEYTFTAPEVEGFEEDAIKGVINEETPMLQHFNSIGKELGWTQAEMDRVRSEYTKFTLKNAEALKAEHIKTLGEGDVDKGQAFVDKNMKFFQANFPQEDFQAIARLAISSEAVKALDTIRQKLNGGRMYAGDGGDDVGEGLTEESLRAKMRTDAYYDPNHPDHEKVHKEVDEGFKKLYPGKVSAG